MGIFDGLLGIEEMKTRMDDLESRMETIETFVEPDIKRLEESEEEVLQVLNEKMTTREMASKLQQSRSFTSLLLNRLERKGKVREAGRSGRELLYERIH